MSQDAPTQLCAVPALAAVERHYCPQCQGWVQIADNIPFLAMGHWFRLVVLPCDHCGKTHFYTMGYSPTSGEWQVVHVNQHEGTDPKKVKAWSEQLAPKDQRFTKG